jgi:uncharacterized membrane protein YphA (DoxX/SURF4 family)
MALDYGHGMAIVRIVTGLYFLVQGIAKMTGGWLSSSDTLLKTFIGPALERNQAEAFYRPFLENVVQPNGLLFSQLVALGEIAVGICFILGLLTRPAAIVAMFLNLNYMLMKGLANGAGSNDRMFVGLELVFLLTAAGLVWGLDGRLRDVLAANPLGRWLVGARQPTPAEA